MPFVTPNYPKTNIPSSIHQQDVQSQNQIPIGNSRRLSMASNILLATGTFSSRNSSKPLVSAKRLTKTASSSAILFLAALLCTLQLTLMTLSLSQQIHQWRNNSKQIFWCASKLILWVNQTTILEQTLIGNAIPMATCITCHLSQEGYAHMLVDVMGSQNDVSSTKMTPYHSSLAINTLSNHDSSLSDTQRETLRHKYRSYLGMQNWLSISTRPDLTTVHSLLASATESPSLAHLHTLQHVGHYIKATSNYGISFSSCSNAALNAFIQFPLDDNNPTKPSPTAFTNSNWGPQDASPPTPQNYHQVSMDETQSICGHLIFLSNCPLVWKKPQRKTQQSKFM
jgi:hypothetical protein